MEGVLQYSAAVCRPHGPERRGIPSPFAKSLQQREPDDRPEMPAYLQNLVETSFPKTSRMRGDGYQRLDTRRPASQAVSGQFAEETTVAQDTAVLQPPDQVIHREAIDERRPCPGVQGRPQDTSAADAGRADRACADRTRVEGSRQVPVAAEANLGTQSLAAAELAEGRAEQMINKRADVHLL